MIKQVKILSSLLLAIAIISTSWTPAFAATTKESVKDSPISPNTVVTSSNIYQVLNSLGLDTGKVKVSESKTKTTKMYTVQDLKNALQENSKRIETNNSNIDATSKKIVSAIRPSSNDNFSGTFTSTSSFTDYDLIFSINANYTSNYAVQEWTSLNSTGVAIRSTAISLVSDQIDSASTHGSFSYSDIVEYADVVVGHYLLVPIGNQYFSTEINSTSIKSTVHFYSSQYIGHH